MKRIGIIIMLGMWFVVASQDAWSATLQLKSGKTVEGEIIEQTSEYLRIKIRGIPIKFYIDEIESINGKKPGMALNKDKVFYAEKLNPQEWEKWFGDKKNYVQNITILVQKAIDIERQAGSQIQQALTGSDYRKAKTINQQAAGQLSRTIDQMKALTPPEVLIDYHSKLIESCEYIIKSIDASLSGGSRYAAYRVTAITLALDAIKQLKVLYSEHGASQESLDGLDDLIDKGFLKGLAKDPVS